MNTLVLDTFFTASLIDELVVHEKFSNHLRLAGIFAGKDSDFDDERFFHYRTHLLNQITDNKLENFAVFINISSNDRYKKFSPNHTDVIETVIPHADKILFVIPNNFDKAFEIGWKIVRMNAGKYVSSANTYTVTKSEFCENYGTIDYEGFDDPFGNFFSFNDYISLMTNNIEKSIFYYNSIEDKERIEFVRHCDYIDTEKMKNLELVKFSEPFPNVTSNIENLHIFT